VCTVVPPHLPLLLLGKVHDVADVIAPRRHVGTLRPPVWETVMMLQKHGYDVRE
jgi:hypothetical protein